MWEEQHFEAFTAAAGGSGCAAWGVRYSRSRDKRRRSRIAADVRGPGGDELLRGAVSGQRPDCVICPAGCRSTGRQPEQPGRGARPWSEASESFAPEDGIFQGTAGKGHGSLQWGAEEKSAPGCQSGVQGAPLYLGWTHELYRRAFQNPAGGADSGLPADLTVRRAWPWILRADCDKADQFVARASHMAGQRYCRASMYRAAILQGIYIQSSDIARHLYTGQQYCRASIYSSPMTGRPCYRVTAFGRVKINSDPTPAVLTTSIFSPCAWMISFTIANPRPVPFLSRPLEASDL